MEAKVVDFLSTCVRKLKHPDKLIFITLVILITRVLFPNEFMQFYIRINRINSFLILYDLLIIVFLCILVVCTFYCIVGFSAFFIYILHETTFEKRCKLFNHTNDDISMKTKEFYSNIYGIRYKATTAFEWLLAFIIAMSSIDYNLILGYIEKLKVLFNSFNPFLKSSFGFIIGIPFSIFTLMAVSRIISGLCFNLFNLNSVRVDKETES